MRAKVADFGLVSLVPYGKVSIVTRVGGTFGCLAPEYVGTVFKDHLGFILFLQPMLFFYTP